MKLISSGYIVTWIVNTLAVMAAAHFVPGISYGKSFVTLILAALVLGVLNTLLKPILVKLSFPFLLVTAGLFYFIINAGLLFLVSYLVKDFEVDGFVPALLGALVITAVSIVCGFFIGDKNAK